MKVGTVLVNDIEYLTPVFHSLRENYASLEKSAVVLHKFSENRQLSLRGLVDARNLNP